MADKIDFDDASHYWRNNKINMGKGCFKYKCEKAECHNIVYYYTTHNKHFDLFATDFDKLNKNNPTQMQFCEDHLRPV